MNVLSLFDGMSCAQIALRELGITPRQHQIYRTINTYSKNRKKMTDKTPIPRRVKEDGMSMNDTHERMKAVMALLDAKRKERKKQYVRIPITKGFKFIEKSKYERQMREAGNQ